MGFPIPIPIRRKPIFSTLEKAINFLTLVLTIMLMTATAMLKIPKNSRTLDMKGWEEVCWAIE